MKKTILLVIISIITSAFQSLSAANPDSHIISETVENWLVEYYLQTTSERYTKNIAYTGNSILEYNDLGPDDFNFFAEVDTKNKPNWAEQPNPIKIPTPIGKEVFVSENPGFTKTTYTFPITSDTTLVYNLIPQKIYWYKIVDSNKNTLDRGVFKTLGRMRAIYCPHAQNIRDIGGWKCNGGRLAYGKVYRGGALENCKGQDEDQTILKEIAKFGTDVDLRHAGEGDSDSPLGINYTEYSIVAYMATMQNYYQSANHPTANTGYYKKVGDMIKYLVNNKTKGAFYYHCTAGADRTGTIIMLIEALCGVSEEDIVKDWELTTFSGYEKMINRDQGNSLRDCLQYLYDNFGGKDNKTLQQQAEGWFKKFVFTSTTDQNKYFKGIRDYLVVPEERSPLLIHEWYGNQEQSCYLQIEEEIETVGITDVYYSATNGSETKSDLFTATDYIDCQDYKYLLANFKVHHLVSFYDKNKNFLSGISADTSNDDTVLLDNATTEYEIPVGAAYAKVNLPKYSNAYMVLSVGSLK